MFVAGWRPFWAGNLAAMLWHFVLHLNYLWFVYSGMPAPDLPVFDTDSLMTVLLGLFCTTYCREDKRKTK